MFPIIFMFLRFFLPTENTGATLRLNVLQQVNIWIEPVQKLGNDDEETENRFETIRSHRNLPVTL